ncbi:MAG: SMP-30/gluconolactonase/LRE family protein, partial [Spirochaetia bacterium]
MFTLAVMAGCVPGWADDHSVIAAGAKLQKLADQFKFTEGPTADAAGNVFFTDQPNDCIYEWSVDG